MMPKATLAWRERSEDKIVPACESLETHPTSTFSECESGQPRTLSLCTPNTAESPNSSSMRSNWLYLAILSERLKEPVLI